MALKRVEMTNPDSCLSKADLDEPVFVLRAHDRLAADTIRHWAGLRRMQRGPSDAKAIEALECANQMDAWRENELSKLFDDNADAIVAVGGKRPTPEPVEDEIEYDVLITNKDPADKSK
jgi:hypothetical protein